MENTQPAYDVYNLNYSKPIKFLAYFFSYVFHPLFIPIYATYYIAFIHPVFFAGMNNQAKLWVLIRVIVNMVLFPGITVLLLKGVGFIDSIFLKTQRDRIIPYIATGIFFFWMYLVLRSQLFIPLIFTSFVFSVFLSSSAALIANIYFKISMHAIGMGGLIGLLLIVLFRTHSALAVPLPLMIILFITGIVCTSRMIITNHTQQDIYFGLFLGIICQFVGASFIL